MSETQPTLDASSSSGSGGMLKWVFIILGGLVLLGVCCGGTCIYSFYSGFDAMAGTINKPKEDLVAELNTIEEVTAKLGSPIEQIPFAESGKFNSNITNNTAKVEIAVRGPNGRADAHGTMTYVGATWKIQNVTLDYDDGTSTTLGN